MHQNRESGNGKLVVAWFEASVIGHDVLAYEEDKDILRACPL